MVPLSKFQQALINQKQKQNSELVFLDGVGAHFCAELESIKRAGSGNMVFYVKSEDP